MRLRGDLGVATLWFRDGELLDGQCGKLRGVNAVFRALRFKTGSYVVEFGDPTRAVRIDAPLSSLVEEGARRAAQVAELVMKLPPFDQLLAVNRSRLGPLDEEQRQLLELFRPHCSIDEALDLTDAGELEALTLLEQLVSSGVLQPASNKARYRPDEPTLEMEIPALVRRVDDEETTAVKEVPRRPSPPPPTPDEPAPRSSPHGPKDLPPPAAPPKKEKRRRPSLPPVADDEETTAVKEDPRLISPSRRLSDAPAARPEPLERPVEPIVEPISDPLLGATPVARISSLPPPPRRRGPLLLLLLVAAAAASLGYVYFAVYQGKLPWKPSEPIPDASARSAPHVASAPPPCPDGMAHVAAGRFFMGSDSKHPELEDANPAHQVEVKAFCIDRHEATVAAYERCVTGGGCTPLSPSAEWPRAKSDTIAGYKRALSLYGEHCNAGKPGRRNHPANCIRFEQAEAFCRHRKARLPTEAEWEFAARGSDGRVYPWGDAAPMPMHANGCGTECQRWHRRVRLEAPFDRVLYDGDDGYEGTAPVGAFSGGATRDGVEDLIGNVAEWVADPFALYRGSSRKHEDEGDTPRVIRGGSFLGSSPEQMDGAARRPMLASVQSPAVGVRCAANPRGEENGPENR